MKNFYGYALKGISILVPFILIGCGAGPGDPMRDIGDRTIYYIENNSNYELKIETKIYVTQIESTKYSVVSAARVLLRKYNDPVSAYKGFISPSKAFIDLRIYADFGAGSRLVYSGVKDEDWKNEGQDAEQNYIQVLSIADSDFLMQ